MEILHVKSLLQGQSFALSRMRGQWSVHQESVFRIYVHPLRALPCVTMQERPWIDGAFCGAASVEEIFERLEARATGKGYLRTDTIFLRSTTFACHAELRLQR